MTSKHVQAFRELHWQEFSDLYPTTSNTRLAEQFGVSNPTILRLARDLGLKKDPHYIAEIRRQKAIGRTLSAETRAKIAAAHQGRSWTEEQRAKILQKRREQGAISGERHYNWKGGHPWKRFAEPRYIAWRTAVLERDGYICQQCGRQCKKRERGLAAHHIKPYAEYPDLRYELTNGLTLCRRCHMSLHNKALSPQEPIPCACGCGTLIDPFDPYGRPRRYVNFHGAKGRKMPESTKQLLREQRQGRSLTSEHRAKISASLQQSRKRIGRPPNSPTSD